MIGKADIKLRARLRWNAVDAFNCVAGITAAARRVGIELILVMDSRTFACFPSESRIAVKLGLSERAVQKAKAELLRAGLVTWSNKGGPRHISRYEFNWELLARTAETGGAAARRHSEGKSSASQEHEPQFGIKHEPQFGIGGGYSASKPALLDAKPEPQFGSNPNPSSAEPIQELVKQSSPAAEADASAAPLTGASSSASTGDSETSIRVVLRSAISSAHDREHLLRDMNDELEQEAVAVALRERSVRHGVNFIRQRVAETRRARMKDAQRHA